MAKNKMSDLNDHLFMQLERLKDDMKPEQMELEKKRSEAIVKVSAQLIKSYQTQLSAIRILSDGSVGPNDMPEAFGVRQINQNN